MSARAYTLGPKQSAPCGLGWSRDVTLADGRVARLNVRAYRTVRIAFKPRGHNIGHHWLATCYCDGKRLFEDRCDKSTGARRILECAGLIPARDVQS